MSRYTTQLRCIVDQTLKDNGITISGMKIDEKLSKVSPFIFSFDYELTTHFTKAQFESDFLRHFYMCEIGAETVALWKLFLEDWLNTNMPYYNQLFDLTYKEFNYDNFKYTETLDGHIVNDNSNLDTTNGLDTSKTVDNTKSDSTANGDSHNFQKYYEVPSNNISTITNHLNNATENDGNYNDNGNQNVDYTHDNTFNTYREMSGKQDLDQKTDNTIKRNGRAGMTEAQISKQYLDIVKNIKKQLFDHMEKDLFMGIW